MGISFKRHFWTLIPICWWPAKIGLCRFLTRPGHNVPVDPSDPKILENFKKTQREVEISVSAVHVDPSSEHTIPESPFI